MPPDDKDPLTPEQIGVLRAWIDQGAKWPQSADVLDPRLERAREHWAFQRLQTIEPPAPIPGDAWSRSDVDTFIAEKLIANQLSPSAPLPAKPLARRIYFDLIGLPPTPDQTNRFEAAFRDKPSVAATVR